MERKYPSFIKVSIKQIRINKLGKYPYNKKLRSLCPENIVIHSRMMNEIDDKFKLNQILCPSFHYMWLYS